ncbi:MAG: Clp protease N-terminal domain-containing protein, partial [Lentimicrobiaceae bacterium]|nr:Clp protease N-terminal domain-containing protein [Lentimicrobiaceae bacterium]
MNLNNFTIKSQQAVEQAQQLAAIQKNQSIETAHLLKGILETDENVTPFLLGKFSANIPNISKGLDAIIQGLPTVTGG